MQPSDSPPPPLPQRFYKNTPFPKGNRTFKVSLIDSGPISNRAKIKCNGIPISGTVNFSNIPISRAKIHFPWICSTQSIHCHINSDFSISRLKPIFVSLGGFHCMYWKIQCHHYAKVLLPHMHCVPEIFSSLCYGMLQSSI